MRARFLLLPLALIATTLLAQQGDRAGEVQQGPPVHIEIPPAPTLTAEEALTTFKLPPGFRIEIVASDPLVHNPVAMAFGTDGRLWVVEMSGFMPNADGKGENAKVGSVVVLEDTDNDGRMDKRTTFLGGLVMPRAIALVDGGVLIGEPPHLWFCRDTNGDDVADEKTEVAPDYGVTTNPEHTANGLYWAMDNWIYNAKHNIRFRYEGRGRFSRETTDARGQWGITQDDAGRIFHNTNSDPLRGDLVPTEYLKRNPFLTSTTGSNVGIVPARLAVWPGRVTPGVNRGYQNLNAEGKITSCTAACGPVIYRSALFPAEFLGNAFVCEPSGNLVKRIVITEGDGTVVGRNAYEGSEFLTSTDERFRPVNLSSGPDGALYLVDMYHGILQHRIFMTSYLRKQVEERGLAEGLGMGRIYRIVPDNTKPVKAKFDLAKQTSAELVSRFSAADSWWRDTAQRLLVERNDPASVPLLREFARSSSSPALGRLHALWTLDGMKQLDRNTVMAAIGSTDESVTAAAIRLSEKWLADKIDREILSRVIGAGGQSTPRITLQKALSLGASQTPEALAAQAKIAAKSGQQPFIPSAIVSGIAGREIDFITLAIAGENTANSSLSVELATSAVFKSRDPSRINEALARLAPKSATPEWGQSAMLKGIERFLPKTPEGKSVAAMLPAEPVALLTLAKNDTAAGNYAAKLIDLLQWTGKPGMENEASAIADRLTPAQKALFEKGSVQFAAICAGCHQPRGEGMVGLAPQLLYSRYVLGSERALARIVLSGKEKEGRVMPGLRTLDDESLAAVLTYIRQSWGHNAPPIEPATIAKVRRETGNREEPWTDDELQAFATRRAK